MKIKNHILQTDPKLCQKILAELLESYLDPAFGTLPKKEVDLLMVQTMETLGYISKEPSLYELVTQLRVTRAKARNLIYDMELRRLNTSELDERVKEALKHPLLQKQGELFVLEIENPLVIDHLRSTLQSLGYASDGSFSPSLVKITLSAVAALLEHYLTTAEQQRLQKILVKAGAPDTSFQGVIKSTVKAIAKKIAKDSGDAMVDKFSDYLSPMLEGATEQVAKRVKGVFS